MAATTGTATLNFGAIGATGNEASIVITGQAAIVAASLVEAWLRLEATAEHPLDDLKYDPVRITAGNIVAGTGFTIYGFMADGHGYGTYSIGWVWN